MIELAEKDVEAGSLSSRVFLYGALATVAVALVLALSFAAMSILLVREADDLRASLVQARAAETTCRISVERLDARLDQYEEWLMAAGQLRRAPSAAGVGGGSGR